MTRETLASEHNFAMTHVMQVSNSRAENAVSQQARSPERAQDEVHHLDGLVRDAWLLTAQKR
ncbi:hypothetical protein GCM10022380_16700 [Amycolatopsis tucumanensis]|uniref:Uncharacterized protein n=1 Tax=Amycolatopsis tucumanensis TaxID=401106 RepID=A0ABP7HQG0_9PSEU